MFPRRIPIQLARSFRQLQATALSPRTNQWRTLSSKMDSATISKITDAEKEITGLNQPVAGGPTAQAQKHANEPITSKVLHDITEGEKLVTGGDRIKGGPTSTAQSELGKAINAGEITPNANSTSRNDPILDSENISRIHEAEKKITGLGDLTSGPVGGGPTAAAQSHAGEPINSQTLHDITEGEKRLTGEDHAVKGGPTSVAQSVLGKSRRG